MLRNFRITDLRQCVGMVYDEWKIWWDYYSDSRIAAWLYVLAIINVSEYLVVYERDGKIAGFAGLECYKRGVSGRLGKRLRAWLCGFVFVMFKYLPVMRTKEIREYYFGHQDDVIPESFRTLDTASGSMFIVRKDLRKNTSIGGRLAKALIKAAYSMQIHRIYAETYDSCDVAFYKKHMTMITSYDPPVPEGKVPDRAYIFSYDVPDLKLVNPLSRPMRKGA